VEWKKETQKGLIVVILCFPNMHDYWFLTTIGTFQKYLKSFKSLNIEIFNQLHFIFPQSKHSIRFE